MVGKVLNHGATSNLLLSELLIYLYFIYLTIHFTYPSIHSFNLFSYANYLLFQPVILSLILSFSLFAVLFNH